MGSVNCCLDNRIFITNKCQEIETINSNISNMNIKRKNVKKNTVSFDKKNFINMKTTNLLDDYELKDKLGEGAYGCVYKAFHKKTKLIRAVKAIKRKHVDKAAFNNEITILKSLDHPNIIRLFECYYDNLNYYMVEEYCPEGDLYDYIKRQRNFSEKKAASIISQLISAVNYLHSKKIVHRDLKPENIVYMETKTNQIFIKIIDFGTSIYVKNSSLTQELGTIYYIAPEVFNNKYNEKADIWSCGVILYTMLSGYPPFRSQKNESIKNKIIEGKVEYLQREWNNVSREGVEFVKELLTYQPNNRPSAQQALKNTWLTNMLKSEDSNDNFLGEHVMKNLLKFHSAVTLQKASLAYIATCFGQNEELNDLKNEFDKIDLNKDGVISKEELFACMSRIYPVHEVESKVVEFFDAIDFNFDGSINFSEFVTVSIEKKRLLCEENLKKAFNMFDIDGNGVITLDELKEIITLEGNNDSDEAWLDIMNEADLNGDCQISLDEFKIMMEKFGNTTKLE